HAAPKVPAGHATERAPRLCEFEDLGWLGNQALAVRLLDSHVDAEVDGGHHVGTAEGEHQEHLCRPAADAFYPREVLDDVFIVHARELLEDYVAADGLLSQVANVAELLLGEPAGLHLLDR